MVVGSSYSRSTMVRNTVRPHVPISYYPGDWRGEPRPSVNKATSPPPQLFAKQASTPEGAEDPDSLVATSHWELYHSAVQLPDGKNWLWEWDHASCNPVIHTIRRPSTGPGV